MATTLCSGRDCNHEHVQGVRAIKRRSEVAPAGLVGVPAATRRDFRRRQFLVEAGCPAEAIYLIRSGYVRTYLLDEDGRETITAILGPGHPVGLGSLLGRATHGRFVEALTDVETWRVPTASLGERLFNEGGVLGLALGSVA